jgi:hypothetical protein
MGMLQSYGFRIQWEEAASGTRNIGLLISSAHGCAGIGCFRGPDHSMSSKKPESIFLISWVEVIDAPTP